MNSITSNSQASWANVFERGALTLSVACIVSAVALLVIAKVQGLPLLLPATIIFGSAIPFLLLSCLPKCITQKKEAPEPKEEIRIDSYILIPVGTTSPAAVWLHPRAIQALYPSSKVGYVMIGRIIFTAFSSDTIPIHSIGLTQKQKNLINQDLGIEKHCSESTLIEHISDELYNSISVAYDVKLFSIKNDANRQKCLVLSKESISSLKKNLKNSILSQEQEIWISIGKGEIGFKVELPSVGGRLYQKITADTLFEFDQNTIIYSEDFLPGLEDAQLEFTIDRETQNEIPLEQLKSAFQKAKLPTSWISLSSGWEEPSRLWREGERGKIEIAGNQYSYCLAKIQSKGQAVKCVKNTPYANYQISLKFDKFEKALDEIIERSIQRVLNGEVESQNPTTSSSSQKLEEESDLTVVERLEKRGVGGLPLELNDVFQPHIHRLVPEKKAVYEELEVKTKNAVLLVGPPGTGKTSIGRHIGAILGCQREAIKEVKMSEILYSLVGDTERSIENLFRRPRGCDFFVIILDEAESLLSKRENHAQDHQSQRVNAFLSQMDGISKKSDFLLIGITNRPQDMDPAFLREGRFGKPIVVDLPDKEGREKIFGIYLNSLRAKGLVEDSVEDAKLAELTDKFSGADIEAVVEEAKKPTIDARIADLGSKRKISLQDLTQAIEHKNKDKNQL